MSTFWNSGQDKEWQHEVIPEPKGIDDHGCRMHRFHHWEDDAEIGCKFISTIDFCCFIQTFWNRDFDIPYIEKEGLWNRIGQVEQDQTKGVGQTELLIMTVIGIMITWNGTKIPRIKRVYMMVKAFLLLILRAME